MRPWNKIMTCTCTPLLQLQLSLQIFKILDPLINFYHYLESFGSMNFVFVFLLLQVWTILRLTLFMLFKKLLMSETALGCGTWSLVWNIALWSVISFFVFRILFLIFSTVSEEKQTSSLPNRKQFFLVWLFRGHLNNVSDPYFLMEPPLRKLNDECFVQ